MNKLLRTLLLVAVVMLTGCATSQTVMLANLTPPANVGSAALVPQDGNSPTMDAHVTQQLQLNGLRVQAPLPAGTRKAEDIDMLVTYGDVWRWDLVMYLKDITINFFDAKSGNLLVSGRWENSALHGFQDASGVVKGLMDEMMAKLKGVQTQAVQAKAE